MTKDVLLSYFLKLTHKRYRDILEFFPSLDAFWEAPSSRLIQELKWKPELAHEFSEWKKEIDEDALERELEKDKITCIPLSHPEYPPLLKTIYDPPINIFVRGTLPQAPELTIAVVGSRDATSYGASVTQLLVHDLSACGVVIVSGLARGIDGLAHETTLKHRGKTIAVLGSGIASRDISPYAKRQLAEKIIESGGAVISEYPPKTPPSNFTFPARNRIIAGVSQATVVIEAAEQSGALITAECTLEAGREVFAVPQNITSPTSIGTNTLIQLGARLVTSAQDILDIFNITSKQKNEATKPELSSLNPTEAAIICLLSNDPLHIDDIIRNSALPSTTVMGTLTRLEIQGKIKQIGGMRYTI